MNRISRSRSIGVVVVLLLANFFLGCTCQECAYWCEDFCLRLDNPFLIQTCIFPCLFGLCSAICSLTEPSQACTDNPDECATTFEQMQIAAIEFCNEYPEECQEAFDAYVEEEDTE